MAEGVKEFGEKTPGVTTEEIGPGKADAAQQEREIEDLIAKKVDAIAVVPFDPPMLEGVLKRAMDHGVKVDDSRGQQPEEHPGRHGGLRQLGFRRPLQRAVGQMHG